ncbi:MAG: adenylate/guanylate cyclase domain-containing protein [Treponema sp.]|jgi:adenylate cyclase|nr:adenylate/guanylate cyclase domain-containing protein [Treponema sp.]
MGKEKRRKIDQIALFPIGAKLVTIVTLIVLISLGSITVLVSWLVRQDLRIAAEESNFEANRRSTAEAEGTLAKMRSDTLTLIYTITSAGTGTALARNNAAYFFRQNSRMAAIFFAIPGKGAGSLVNERFFHSRDIDLSLVDTFRNNHQATLLRAAAGETIVINATPQFAAHLLAMFIPGETGGAMVLFSPENLDTSFGSGLNQSWMINRSGDILIHADFELVRSGVNVSGYNFIRNIQESPDRNKQSIIETDFGVMRSSAANKNIFYSTWKTVKQFVIRLYNICADAVCKALKVERGAPQNETQSRGERPETVRQFVAYTKLGIGGCTVITSIGYDKVFEGIAATTRRNIYLTIAVLSFSIMLIWFFSKSISVPIKALAVAARKVEGGTFDLELQQAKGRDEISMLTISFQKMCSALRIFGRFTNKEIALKAMRGQIKLGGIQKHATIFFSDIREFTAKSETFTKVFGEDASDKIVHWLNDYFSHMVECVEKTNGTIDKFIGDAVMAHWGAAYTSGSPERDAFSCVAAALMMRKSLYEMNKKHRQGDLDNPPIRIGCGINTGMVTAGQLGSDIRMEYTVIGDPVNLASRIEALNKPLGTDILISEDTWKLVNKRFITEEMPSVTVKGKEQPVRIFAVVNLSGIGKGPKTLADVRKLLGIEPPDTAHIDVNADEKKYKIGETNPGGGDS